MKKPSKEILDKASCYQYILDGMTYNLSEMDRGQLMRALMHSLDTLDELQDKLANVSEIFDRWHDGDDGDPPLGC